MLNLKGCLEISRLRLEMTNLVNLLKNRVMTQSLKGGEYQYKLILSQLLSAWLREAWFLIFAPGKMIGPLAQRLEQRTHNPLVAGSNPAGPTMNFAFGEIQSR